MKKIMLIATLVTLSGQAQPLKIAKQGNFTVGGTLIQREGVYDNSQFGGWATPIETGQPLHVDHAFVHFQIPVKARPLPLVFVHGYGSSGVCWEMTPDGRDGFTTLMLRQRYATYVMDLPGRGRAGKTSATLTLSPKADEAMWFDIWRMGDYPAYNAGVQFPQDKEALSQFFREMTPNLSDGKNDVSSIVALAERIGGKGCVVVTHSAGGISGWLAAIQSPEVKAVVSYEPGAFVFPEDELPEPMPSLTGTVKGVAVSKADFETLVKKPIILYFGDYIPETPSHRLGDENWRVRLAMARKFAEVANAHGGKVTLVELPKIGIKGNTHFLMQDLNNEVLAKHLGDWLRKLEK